MVNWKLRWTGQRYPQKPNSGIIKKLEYPGNIESKCLIEFTKVLI